MASLRAASAWIVGFVCLITATAEAAPPRGDSLLSNATKAFISIPDYPKLRENFNRSQLGRLLNDPAMKGFKADLNRQLTAKGGELRDKIGLSLDDLETLATGELTLSVAATAEGKAAVMILIDVSENPAAAQIMLDKNSAFMTQQGAKRTVKQAGGTNLIVYDIPPKGHVKEWIQAVYFLKDGVLGIGTHLQVVADVANRLAATDGNALASLPVYQEVIKRASQGASDFQPQVVWFVDPVGLADAARAGHAKKGGLDILKLVKAEGFDAVQGLGGLVSFTVGHYGFLHRTAIHAPGPFKRSMQMLKFENGGEFAPQAWVPADVATYISLQWDMKHAFDHFGTLFDYLFGEGEEGVWLDVMDSLKTDPNGPRLDMRNDLIANLGQRTTIITDNLEPITPHSQRRLIAAEATNEKKLAAAVERMMKNDKSVIPHDFNGHKIYEVVPEEDVLPELEVEQPGGVKQKAAVKKEEAPHSAVGVAHGHLFIATHVDLLKKVLAQAQTESPLANHGEYRIILNEVNKLGQGEANYFLQGFARNPEKWLVTYEMFRQGRLPETETPIAALLNAVLNDAPEGQLRMARFDGSALPDFEVVRNYLGNGGQVVTRDETGWFFIGFTLNKDARAATEARLPGATE